MSFQSGADKGVTWTPDSTGTPVTICITQWSVDDGGDIIDVTSTCHDGKQAFIAGIQRMNGSVTGFIEATNLPSDIGLKFGAKGTLGVRLTTGTPNRGFTIHVIIEKVTVNSAVNGAVNFQFSYKSDALNAAGATVTSITYP